MSKKKDDRATVKAARINIRGIIIAAFITLIGVFGVYLLQKPESPINVKNENNTMSTQTINKEDLLTEEKKLKSEYEKFDSSLDNKVEITSKPEKQKPQLKEEIEQKSKNTDSIPSTTHIDKIENKGNLSIGQTGGTVNQTTIINPKSQPRHMTESIMKILQGTIPSGFTVSINHPMSDEESTNFALEMKTILNSLGYKTTRSIYGQIVPDLNQSHIIELNHQEQKAEIIVYKLK